MRDRLAVAALLAFALGACTDLSLHPFPAADFRPPDTCPPEICGPTHEPSYTQEPSPTQTQPTDEPTRRISSPPTAVPTGDRTGTRPPADAPASPTEVPSPVQERGIFAFPAAPPPHPFPLQPPPPPQAPATPLSAVWPVTAGAILAATAMLLIAAIARQRGSPIERGGA